MLIGCKRPDYEIDPKCEGSKLDFPFGKSGLPKAFCHLSNGFSGLAKGLWRSANHGSSLAKDTLYFSEGYFGFIQRFLGFIEGKTGFPAKKLFGCFNYVVVACL